jgi:hypothetical protein
MPGHVALLIAALLALSGCRSNPQYCEGNIGNNCELAPTSIDGQIGCVRNDQCAAPASICDVPTSTCIQCTLDQPSACTGDASVCGPANTCVQCTAAQPAACGGATPICDVTNTCVQCTADHPSACAGATPVCNADNKQCQKCTADAQCTASSICLDDGSCAPLADVAYVTPAPVGTDNATCEKAVPCISVSKALQTSRRYVKISGTIDEAISINDQDVTLLGEPNAGLTSTKNGLLLEIRGTSHVTVSKLAITGASGSTGVGISMPPGGSGSLTVSGSVISNNQGGGISAGSSGSLNVSRSAISNNQGGGISIAGGTFDIVGNMFYSNGDDNTPIGGISITAPQNAANRLEFNSFSRNQAQDGLGTAVQCVAGTFTARNNIMSQNGTLSNPEQVGGTCKHAYSVTLPGTVPAGTNNSASDPGFVDAARGDLHIQAASPARRAADPSSDLTGIASQDIDGDARLAPADIGADQVK